MSRSGALLEFEVTPDLRLIQEGEELAIEIPLDDSIFGRRSMYFRGCVTRAYGVEEMIWRIAVRFRLVGIHDASRLEAPPVTMRVM